MRRPRVAEPAQFLLEEVVHALVVPAGDLVPRMVRVGQGVAVPLRRRAVRLGARRDSPAGERRPDRRGRLHDPELLTDLIADDCVIEGSGPAPDGVRREGGRACLARWSELAGNRALRFTPEPAEIHGDLAVQPWLLQWGDGEQDSVRGVNLIRIRGGRIVEARGYVKA
ncbi:nuclear transport factor 2 family protein [Jiangella endophytica]|uniref:nuclear transport factor 2 family protein n=1 Tax=Jiangella endophytica TaxID=1623398 RepID=UPI0018E4EDC9|nr:nuclear transport factor 2 family protein [Jiangella endophytica]